MVKVIHFKLVSFLSSVVVVLDILSFFILLYSIKKEISVVCITFYDMCMFYIISIIRHIIFVAQLEFTIVNVNCDHLLTRHLLGFITL